MSEKELSEKHKRFIDLYFEYKLNAFKAYREVYPNAAEASALTKSVKLLKEVQKSSYFIEKRQKTSEKSEINFEWWTKQLKKIASIGVGELEIEKTNKEGEKYKTKHMDLKASSDALDKLAKAFLFYPTEKQKIEISGTGENGKIEIVRKII
jgi:4-hydroxy-L-threonine phosphate dehydrogenase PdxA